MKFGKYEMRSIDLCGIMFFAAGAMHLVGHSPIWANVTTLAYAYLWANATTLAYAYITIACVLFAISIKSRK